LDLTVTIYVLQFDRAGFISRHLHYPDIWSFECNHRLFGIPPDHNILKSFGADFIQGIGKKSQGLTRANPLRYSQFITTAHHFMISRETEMKLPSRQLNG
jgi:hypothetical protein